MGGDAIIPRARRLGRTVKFTLLSPSTWRVEVAWWSIIVIAPAVLGVRFGDGSLVLALVAGAAAACGVGALVMRLEPPPVQGTPDVPAIASTEDDDETLGLERGHAEIADARALASIALRRAASELQSLMDELWAVPDDPRLHSQVGKRELNVLRKRADDFGTQALQVVDDRDWTEAALALEEARDVTEALLLGIAATGGAPSLADDRNNLKELADRLVRLADEDDRPGPLLD